MHLHMHANTSRPIEELVTLMHLLGFGYYKTGLHCDDIMHIYIIVYDFIGYSCAAGVLPSVAKSSSQPHLLPTTVPKSS